MRDDASAQSNDSPPPVLVLSLTKDEYEIAMGLKTGEDAFLMPQHSFLEDIHEAPHFDNDELFSELSKLNASYRVAIPSSKVHNWLRKHRKKLITFMPSYFDTLPYAFASVKLSSTNPVFMRERYFLTESNRARVERNARESKTTLEESLLRMRGAKVDGYALVWKQYLRSTTPFSEQMIKQMVLPEIWIDEPIRINHENIDVRRNGNHTFFGKLIEKYL